MVGVFLAPLLSFLKAASSLIFVLWLVVSRSPPGLEPVSPPFQDIMPSVNIVYAARVRAFALVFRLSGRGSEIRDRCRESSLEKGNPVGVRHEHDREKGDIDGSRPGKYLGRDPAATHLIPAGNTEGRGLRYQFSVFFLNNLSDDGIVQYMCFGELLQCITIFSMSKSDSVISFPFAAGFQPGGMPCP
jgi:hypothetical protein